jgi:hypothetical protein
MSILPLTGILGSGLAFFLLSLETWETFYVTESGQDKQVIQGRHNIDAGVDPSGSQKLQRMFGGSVSDGDIGITTHEVLHVGDIYVPGALQRQTFVKYEGLDYRIVDRANWTQQAGMSVYLATRHITQDQL